MKKVMTFLIAFFICFSVGAINLDIKSNNAILYNMNDNSVIYEKNSNDIKEIASLTKIMTAIVVIDNTSNLEEKVEVKNYMLNGLNGYAKAGLKEGNIVTVKDLLYALMLPSGADAAQILAISTSGSIDKFVEEMNNKVKQLKLKNTHFDNVIGMDSTDNYSTAKEVSDILKYALNNNDFKQIFTSNEYTINSIDLKLKKTTNSKAKLYGLDVSNIEGSKTGYTDEAGLCLASTASINGVNYLLVTLNAPIDYPYHLKDSIDIYNYFSSNYSYRTIIGKNQKLVNLKVKHGKKKNVDILSDKKIDLYLNNDIGLNKLEYKYKGKNEINKKIKVGDKLGDLYVINDGKVIYKYKVVLNIKVEYINYKLYISLGVIIIFVIILLKKKKKRSRR